jgi:hypothetical protein
MANEDIIKAVSASARGRMVRDYFVASLCLTAIIAIALVTAKVYSTLDAARIAIQHADDQVNRNLLPVLTADMDRVATSTENVSDSIGDVRSSMVATLIPTMVTDLDNTTGSISKVAGSIDATRTQLDRLIIISSGAVTNIEKATRDLDAQESAQIAYLNSTAANMVKLTNDADRLVSDPELDATLRNLGAVTKNLDDVTGNAAKLSDFYYQKLTSPKSLAIKVGEGVGHYLSLFAGALVGTWH